MLRIIPDIISKAKESLKTTTAKEAFEISRQKNGIIIDVREKNEYAEKSAKGTINIPRGLLEMKMLDMYPDEDQTIFVYCATGARAVFSAEQLKRVGYKNVAVITCKLDDICDAYTEPE